MPGATSIEPLLLAVEQVLADGYGAVRPIGTANRFKIGLYAMQGDDLIAALAREKKLADVRIAQQVPDEQSETLPFSHLSVTVIVDMGYYLGHEAMRSELRSTYALAALDFHRIRSALCYPSNLVTESGGLETGLAGGQLMAVGSSWREVTVDTETGVYIARAMFPAIVYLSF